MSRMCSTCRSIIRDDDAVFCDRCGTRLPPARPAVPLTCRICGKVQTDRLSRFCDRCGSPLESTAPPPIPVVKRVVCPSCGFSNTGGFLAYCGKCGSPLAMTGPVPARRAPLTGPVPGTRPVTAAGPVQAGPAGMPRGKDAGARPGGTPAVPPGAPASAYTGLAQQAPAYPAPPPLAPEQPSPVQPAPASPLPAPDKAAVKEPLRKRRTQVKKAGSLLNKKMIAAVAAGVVLLILATTIISGIIPGTKEEGAANASASKEPAPGLFESVFSLILPGQGTGANNATAVITDTPLAVKTTPAKAAATQKPVTAVKNTTTIPTSTPADR